MIASVVVGKIGRAGIEIVEDGHACYAIFTILCRARGVETVLRARVDGAGRAARISREFRAGDVVTASGDLTAFTSTRGRIAMQLRVNTVSPVDFEKLTAHEGDDDHEEP